MKKSYLMVIAALLVVVSCAKQEEAINVREVGVASTFEFPQGDTPTDQKLVEIYEQFGVRCIYKGFSKEDLNQSWSSGTTGKTGMEGEAISDEKLLNFYTTFFIENIFHFFKPENVRGIFPPTFYFIQNYSKKTLNIFWEHPSFPNAPEYYGDVQERIFTGLGFWGFCFVADDYLDMLGMKKSLALPVTELDYAKRKELILKNIIDMMIKKGKIKYPKFLDAGIATDLDYVTAVTNTADKIDDKNYYKRRGFPEMLRSLTIYASPSGVLNSGGKVKMTSGELFIDYLWLGVRYPKAEIEVNYKDFPLVLKYYKLVADYMLTNYELDLNAMAQLPTVID